MASAETASASRRPYIDWARGLAVLIMIEAHTLDAWTRTSSRPTLGFQYLSVLGGFGAPLFLWLAGLSLALSAERLLMRTGSRRQAVETSVKRGAQIFILAFLFRLQAFIVSPGSWPVTMFRVDILNVMGPAIAAAGLLWGAAKGSWRAVLACGVAATAIAMVTPLLRAAAWVDVLPLWGQWYIRPFGDFTTFTLFPWAGFTFAGASCGVLLARATGPGTERRVFTGLGLAGAALVWLGFYTASQPSIYAVSSFWTSSPTFFAIRMGSMFLLLGAFFLASRTVWHGTRRIRMLESFGSNSLFIYWIHVELVYGYATWGIHHRLPLWGTIAAAMLFTVLMYQAILLRTRVVDRWRSRGLRKAAEGAVPG